MRPSGEPSERDYSSSITLILTSEDLCPERITVLMGMFPDQFWKKGDKRQGGRPFDFGGWKVFQPESLNSESLDVQLEHWFEKLHPKAAVLSQIRAMNISVELNCYVDGEDTISLMIDSDLLQKLGLLPLDISFNIFRRND